MSKLLTFFRLYIICYFSRGKYPPGWGFPNITSTTTGGISNASEYGITRLGFWPINHLKWWSRPIGDVFARGPLKVSACVYQRGPQVITGIRAPGPLAPLCVNTSYLSLWYSRKRLTERYWVALAIPEDCRSPIPHSQETITTLRSDQVADIFLLR